MRGKKKKKKKKKEREEEQQSGMIQSPGGGSACHGVSLFIWREYGLQDDGGAKKKEIKHLQKGKKKKKKECAASYCRLHPACLGGRHVLDGRGCDFTPNVVKSENLVRKVFEAAEQVLFLLKLGRFFYSFFFLVLRCRSRPQLVCVGRMCVFAQAPWLAESYFVSVEKVWDGMSGLCLTEHVCACVGGECV